MAFSVTLATAGCPAREQPAYQRAAQKIEITSLLTQLTSPNEAERFKVLEDAKKQVGTITVKHIEHVLISLRKKNVSTLIFVLMQTGSDALYHMGPPARMAAENSEGSFPNIAYYYARVHPDRGLSELFRLYEKHQPQRLAICKAIGEVDTPQALVFLTTRAKAEKEAGRSILPFLAGLRASNKAVDKKEIAWFLEQDLDREEIIALSHLKCRLEQAILVQFYEKGTRKRAYALQRIFGSPHTNFEALQVVIEQEIEAGRHDTVLQWMMSDSMQRAKDQQVKQHREAVLGRVRKLTQQGEPPD